MTSSAPEEEEEEEEEEAQPRQQSLKQFLSQSFLASPNIPTCSCCNSLPTSKTVSVDEALEEAAEDADAESVDESLES